MNQSTERITINPNVCNGRPTVRNMRFTVAQLLELLAAGMSEREILALHLLAFAKGFTVDWAGE